MTDLALKMIAAAEAVALLNEAIRALPSDSEAGSAVMMSVLSLRIQKLESIVDEFVLSCPGMYRDRPPGHEDHWPAMARAFADKHKRDSLPGGNVQSTRDLTSLLPQAPPAD